MVSEADDDCEQFSPEVEDENCVEALVWFIHDFIFCICHILWSSTRSTQFPGLCLVTGFAPDICTL